MPGRHPLAEVLQLLRGVFHRMLHLQRQLHLQVQKGLYAARLGHTNPTAW